MHRLLLSLILVGCGASDPPSGSGSQGLSSSGESVATTSGGTDSTTGVPATSTGSSTSATSGMSPQDTGDEPGGGSVFLQDPDAGAPCRRTERPDGSQGLLIECSVERQDCCPGEACRAWDNSGGDTWNASRCVMVDAGAGQAGETCTVEQSAVSGIDSCDVGLMCWEVDDKTLEGSCVQYCGDEGPACTGAGEVCAVFNDDSLPLCLPSCNPLGSDCGEGRGCYPNADAFVCLREGERTHVDFVFQPDCPAGTFHAPDDVTSCPDDGPCCTAFCNVNDPDACGGAQCLPYFDAPPPEHAALGYCSVAG